MTRSSIREYVEAIRERYVGADRREKGRMKVACDDLGIFFKKRPADFLELAISFYE